MDVQSIPAHLLRQDSVSIDAEVTPLAPQYHEASTLSYQDLCDSFVPALNSIEKKVARTYLNYWLKSAKKTLSSPVGNELHVEFDRYFSAFRNSLDRQGYKAKTIANASTIMSKLRAHYVAWLGGLDLPKEFPEALRMAISKAGFTLREFKRTYVATFGTNVSQINKWLAGTVDPDYHRTRARGRLTIQRIESLCGLLPDTLCSRVFTRAPVLLLEPSQSPNAYRDFHSLIVNNDEFDYQLRPLPSHLQKSFDLLVEWKTATRHNVNGKWFPVVSKERWAKQASIDINRTEIEAFFGFLILPKTLSSPPSAIASSPLLGGTAAERMKRYTGMKTGMGMKVEDLRFTMVVDTVLLEKYALFRQKRNVHEYITDNIVASCIHKASFVIKDKPDAFFRAHPDFRKELDPVIPADRWLEWCDTKHTETRNLINTLNKTASKIRSRNPSTPVEHVLDDKDPIALMTELGGRLLSTLPPPSCRVTRALQYRNGMLILLMLFEPLRASHWPRLEIGKQIVKDQNTGLWRIDIKASEFKNYLYGHAQDRTRVLPKALSDIVDTYISEYRQVLYCPDDPIISEPTNIFLLKSRTGDAVSKNPEPYLTENGFYNLFANVLQKYLGIPVGPHVIRHIAATAWLLEHPGDYVTAAAMLNDSAETVRSKYSHLVQGRVLSTRDDDFAQKMNASVGK